MDHDFRGLSPQSAGSREKQHGRLELLNLWLPYSKKRREEQGARTHLPGHVSSDPPLLIRLILKIHSIIKSSVH